MAQATQNTNADGLEDVVELGDETARKAQRVVASYSSDAEECRMLLDMLGIGPETPEVE